jgi:hypothetical protein
MEQPVQTVTDAASQRHREWIYLSDQQMGFELLWRWTLFNNLPQAGCGLERLIHGDQEAPPVE